MVFLAQQSEARSRDRSKRTFITWVVLLNSKVGIYATHRRGVGAPRAGDPSAVFANVLFFCSGLMIDELTEVNGCHYVNLTWR
jgi:hypothetical protein